MPNAPHTGFETYQEQRPAGLVGRFFVTLGQFLGLLFGAANVYVQRQAAAGEANFLLAALRTALFFSRPFLDQQLIQHSFPVQFRLRLERLGPTYIKFGQILSLREDMLPKAVTDELKNLLDRLPVVSFERYQALIVADLKRPLDTIFRWLNPEPLGSASLAQTQRAQLLTGETVAVKVLKPGVRQTIQTDTKLLRLFGRLLQIFLSRYQPKRLIDEFCRYTLCEVDLRFEADNAEIFAANFKDQPAICFPKILSRIQQPRCIVHGILRRDQTRCPCGSHLAPEENEKVVGLGVSAIIQMIFRDGFFHADLHPGNLIIFKDARLGFIDLGMVGRFDRELQHRLFYYFYWLVKGDADNAARYLASLALPAKNSDVDGFRRAVAGLYGRWLRSANFNDFSLGQVILQSILLAGQYQIQYPGEIILMIKALVTVEGVGNVFQPGIDIVEISSKDVQRLLLEQFNPLAIMRASILVLPELLDILNRSPLVLSEGLKQFESSLGKPANNSSEGIANERLGSVVFSCDRRPVCGRCTVAALGSACFPVDRSCSRQ